ncbi:ATP-binding protein [Rhizobium sp. ZPR3]|uniref:histidine kinase n=2 Tax=unclassified Rhizobium TaxID=2613769 RepID=A0AAU7SQH9_9HYPH
MTRNMLWPSSIKNQIFLLSALPIVVLTILAVFAKSFSDVEQARREWASFTSGQLIMLAEGVRRAESQPDLDNALQAVMRAGFTGELVNTSRPVHVPNMDQQEELREHLTTMLAKLVAEANPIDAELRTSEVSLAITGSRLLVFRNIRLRDPSAYGVNLANDVIWVSLFVLPALGLSLYLSLLIIRPLIRFTQMARRVSDDDDVPNLFMTGQTSELRSLAEPFSALAAKVKTIIEGRSQMLRAMGHDLRTPLTRLRMRVECCPDGELQRQMLGDIEAVTNMIDENMSYLRNATSDVGLTRKSDLTSLIQTVVAGFSDMGISIAFSGPSRLPLTCKPRLLARAVSNLIDNASRYAKEIEVALDHASNGEVTICVNDNGPGLPNDMKLKVMEGFFTASQGGSVRQHGGVGLGLAIAHGIAERHGGALSLHDQSSGGLSARLTIRSLDELPQKSPPWTAMRL